MDYFRDLQVGLPPAAEQQVMAGMKLAAVVAHKALVLVHLTEPEMEALIASVAAQEMRLFAGDIREVQRTLRSLCEVLGAAERRISQHRGRANDVIN